MLRRSASVLALVLVLGLTTGCSLKQMEDYFAKVPIVGQLVADQAVAAYEATKAEATAGHHCPEWYDAAMDAGFTPEQWKEPLSRIMYRESMCNPLANNNSSTADGLTQIVRGTWLSSCPDLNYGDRYIGEVNLQCAFRVSGGGHYWGPWVTY